MTYKQLTTTITNLLESHKMINTVRFANPIEWINWDNQPVFPCALFAINNGVFNIGREQVYSVTFWFLDKSGVEGEFETEVTSDQHSIAADIISTLRKQSNAWTIGDSIGWDAVSEQFEEYLAGVTLTLNINIVSDYDACNMPV